MTSSQTPVVAFGTANAVKGKIPAGFEDGVSLMVIKTTQTQQPYRLPIGEHVEPISDSTRRSLGFFRVVGTWVPDTGEIVGEVPNRSLPMWHCK
jgi:hypothetical protein